MELNHQNDEVLLEGLRRGDANAFELIFRKYWRELYLVAKAKLYSHDDAEEIIQSIFSNLWEKRSTLLIHDLGHYLHTSVKNRIINYIRDNITKETYWARYAVFLPKHEDNATHAVDLDELEKAIETALQSLPEKSREVFHLSRVEGKSTAEIANQLSLSQKAIEYHLTKSLKNLKVILRDHIL
ncbi:MAG TPA: RNA polymerase sigma-70 factor [Ohtaekwangia sp.]|nr:RNA polymerase sigma-70 factor [Ohtaekwangia sp.]